MLSVDTDRQAGDSVVPIHKGNGVSRVGYPMNICSWTCGDLTPTTTLCKGRGSLDTHCPGGYKDWHRPPFRSGRNEKPLDLGQSFQTEWKTQYGFMFLAVWPTNHARVDVEKTVRNWE